MAGELQDQLRGFQLEDGHLPTERLHLGNRSALGAARDPRWTPHAVAVSCGRAREVEHETGTKSETSEGNSRHKVALQVKELVLSEMVIQNQYSRRSRTRFNLVLGLVGVGFPTGQLARFPRCERFAGQRDRAVDRDVGSLSSGPPLERRTVAARRRRHTGSSRPGRSTRWANHIPQIEQEQLAAHEDIAPKTLKAYIHSLGKLKISRPISKCIARGAGIGMQNR